MDFKKISALLAKGRSLHEAGRPYEAIQFYRQVLECQPHNLEALNNLAIALKQEKQFTEAIALLRQALTIEPNAPYLHNNLANILWQDNQLEAAKAHYQQALTVNPNYADAWYGLGNVFASLGELERAISSYQAALSRNPHHPETYNNLGNALQAQGRLKEALDCYQKTLELNPNHPGARWNQGFTLLLAGDLERGFKEYEWRWQMRGGNFRSPRNFPQPLWDGSDIRGKRILLHCEQGFGDAIQFVRYVELVKERVGEVGRVILECPPPLLRLFESLLHLDQLVLEGQSLPDFDVYAPLMSLPRILGTTLTTIPADIPYLYAEDTPTSFHLFKPEAGRGEVPRKIGIVWAGNPFYQGDRSRYRACSLQHFLRLLDYKIAANLPIQLYSLQKEVTPAELSLLSANNIRDIGSKLKDFADTAQAIAPLDLVISVDTAVAHLAGAMAKPVWVLLPFAPDWRWMLNRTDSPWYPSVMRLFRQSQPGDWDGVFEQVKLAILDLINPTGKGALFAPRIGESPAAINPANVSLFGSGDETESDRLHKQGVIAYQAGDLSAAIAYYHQALEINPYLAKTHNNLAVALKQQGNLIEAIAHYRQAVIYGNANELPLATIYQNLAISLEAIGEFAEAIKAYQSAINLSPNLPEAHYNLARLLENSAQTEAAIWHYREAIKYQPNFAQAYSNLGNILRKINKLDAAISCYKQAIEILPDYAEAHWNLGISLLYNGELKQGFAEYEWRWKTPDFPRRSFPQPLWDGKPLNGQTILLYSEQGFGDQIQFIRYVILVAEQGGRIIVECPQPLARLFETVPCVQQIVVKGEPLPAFDCHCPLMSLPYIFGTTLATIPAPIPYVKPPLFLPQKIQDNSLLLNPNFQIGIVWAGNPNHHQDALRSCELRYFLPLLNLPEVKLYSLQKGDRAKDLATIASARKTDLSKIENLNSQLNDFADTAAIVDQLDLVITVDTAIAHLAGAMGKPVWLLLGNHQDWRWMQGREDSPWYPTMRIFRQSQPGDWEELFQRVFSALEVTLREWRNASDSYQLEIEKLYQLIAQQPDYAEAYHNLGYAFKQQGNLLRAIAYYQKALELKPDYFKAHYHLGNVLLELNQVPEAIAHYEAAINLEPQQADAHTNLGFALLIAGDFRRGFAEYEWRLKRDDSQKFNPSSKFNQPAWDGSPMPEKTILLYTEAGFGDSIQFIRYVPLVAAKFAQVILRVPPSLQRLFATVPTINQVILETDNLPDFDVHASLMSLPHLLGTTRETIPANIPYLFPDLLYRQSQANVNTPPLFLGEQKKYKIGIVWAGSDRYGNQRDRSCELADFYSLMDQPGLSFYSLQVGEKTAQLSQQTTPVLVTDLGSKFQDFADTAQAIASLDLVITIDTSVAHLAGAMGKPVWVLLPFSPDWRWGLNSAESPWYPTMRLFRQPQPGDWKSVFHQLKLALIALEKIPDQGRSHLTSSTTMSLSYNGRFNGRFRLGMGWQLSQMTGWGIYGMNLALQLLKSPSVSSGFYPVLLMPPAINLAELNPLYRTLLQPVFSNYQKLQELISRHPGKQIACDFPVIHALGKNLTSLNTPRGNKNIGVIFLEDTNITAEACLNAEKYDLIIAGSTWNEKLLKHYGINHVCTVQQGIDPTIFHPAPKSNLWGDRFVIFSGGKLEFRKGQDIVIAAFKEFHRRHPEALLITAWHNFWPQYMQGLEKTGNVVGLPEIGENNQIKIAEWLVANGLPPDSFIDLGIVPNHQIGQIVREADVAIFTSRCEGGTNLAAMETMACGIPTILSANTGHLDLIHDHHCYALSRQRPVQPTPHFFTGVVGWGESEVSEAIGALEKVYFNRREAKEKGLKAAKFMENWTWEKQVERFLAQIEDIL